MFASCSKSEIVDSKFGNDEIGFQTYLGRDAQTKATVTDNENLESVKVFGYYGGEKTWAQGQSALWTNGIELGVSAGTVTQPGSETGKEADKRYWANDTDLYSFLAYVPTNGVSEVTGEATPTIAYVVDNNFGSDVLVAVPQLDRTKSKLSDNTDVSVAGEVDLKLEHKLSRLTVKTDVTEGGAFQIRIKNISLTGDFYSTAEMALDNPTAWTGETGDFTYTFHDVNDVDVARPTGVNDLAATTDDGNGKGYLMMIPVEATDHNAELYVQYTTYDPVAKQESRVYDATYTVTNDFVMGYAYAITLQFSTAADLITFDVDVDKWEDGTATYPEKE